MKKNVVALSAYKHLVSLAAAAVTFVAAPASGAVPESGQPAEAAGLQEVTVTARKRTESLQEVPIAVSTTSGVDVDRMGVRTMDEISQSTPGLFFAAGGGGGNSPHIAMRGDTTRATIVQNDVPVGMFMDGIYTASAAQIMNGPVDVKRVEVLAGPQGTLYGRNTISGAINVITNDPTDAFEGRLKLGGGAGAENNEHLWSGEGMVSGPLGDTVSGRIVYAHKQRDGFQYNTFSHTHLGYSDEDYSRAKLRWVPNDAVQVKFGLEYSKNKEPRSDALGAVPGGGFSAYTGPFPTNAFLLPGYNASLYDLETNAPSYAVSSLQRGYVQVDWDLPYGTLTSLSSYAHSKTDAYWDNDQSRFDAQVITWALQSNTLSQELRLAGNSGAFTWLGGLFYLGDDVKRDHIGIHFGPDSPTRYTGNIDHYNQDQPQKTDSYATFGQLGYSFTPDLSLTLGGRWSKDKKTSPFSYQNFLASTGALNVSTILTRRDSWASTTGLASLSYRLAEHVMSYVSYSTGFKAGGFQGNPSPVVADTHFNPETVAQVEGGLKSLWADNRVRLNLAVYHLKYDSLQVNNTRTVNGAPLQLIGNAAGAKVDGLDLDLTVAPAAGLTLGLKYNWTPTAKIVGYSTIAGFPNIEGFRLTRTPKQAYTASAGYERAALGGQFDVAASLYHRGLAFGELDATKYADGSYATAPIPAFTLLNFNAGFERGLWRIDGYLRNALNKAYIATKNATGGGGRFEFMSIGEPRTWEVSLTRNFK